VGLFSSDDEDDETAKPDAAPAAAEPKQMSNDDMIAAALISLAPGLVGGMMGGKRGALAGVGAGTKAAADMAGHMAKKNDEDEAIVKKSAADSLNRKNDLLDFEEKEQARKGGAPPCKREGSSPAKPVHFRSPSIAPKRPKN
jgi:hypothetical protein